ncbi:hypothetical protein [Cellulomonas sp. P5_E12]
MSVPAPPPEFVELHDECLRLGYLYGLDYFIWHIPAELSSELIVLGLDGDSYTVSYRDMGTQRLLLRTDDFAVARARFLDELGWLAGPRGRGPYVGRKSRAEVQAESWTVEEATEDFYRRYGRPGGQPGA